MILALMKKCVLTWLFSMNILSFSSVQKTAKVPRMYWSTFAFSYALNFCIDCASKLKACPCESQKRILDDRDAQTNNCFGV